MAVDKKRVWRSLEQLQRVPTWQLVILLVLAIFASATFLRLNNIGMVERRSAVITADNAGNDDITRNRLYDLQRYVSSHMNTDMGKGIYLESGYKRDVQAAYAKVSTINIYKQAQEACAPKFTSWSTAYVQCTVTELAKYPSSDELKLPDASLYLHVYESPVWSPDFAGWSVVVCVVILIMILLRITGVVILRILLHRHYKSI